jgi:hypothetical protein
LKKDNLQNHLTPKTLNKSDSAALFFPLGIVCFSSLSLFSELLQDGAPQMYVGL